MSVTSWTSEGMDWSSAESLKLKSPYPYLQALYFAAIERCKLFNAVFSGDYWPSSGYNELRAVPVGPAASLIETICFNPTREYENALDFAAFMDGIAKDGSSWYVNYWPYLYSRTVGVLVSTPFGDLKRPYLLPDESENLIANQQPIGPMLSTWIFQRYQILNRLVDCWYLTGQNGSVYAGRCIGLTLNFLGMRLVDGDYERPGIYHSKLIESGDLDAVGVYRFTPVPDMSHIGVFVSGKDSFAFRDW